MAYNPARLSLLAQKLESAGILCGLSVEAGVVTATYDKDMTDEQKATGDAIIAAFDFNVPPPNERKFLRSIILNDDIPANIYPYIPILRSLAGDPDVLKVAWSKIESTLGLTLNQQARTAIESEAASSDMPVK